LAFFTASSLASSTSLAFFSFAIRASYLAAAIFAAASLLTSALAASSAAFFSPATLSILEGDTPDAY